MAVIIENMEMPKSCYECRFSEPAYSGNRCDNMIGHKYSEILSERVKDCPLKEVPSGKWIIKDGREEGYDIGGMKTWYIQIKCNRCGFIKTAIEGHTGQYKYCPSCGSKMFEPQEARDKENNE